MARSVRNEKVEQTVDRVLSVVDDYLQADLKAPLPQSAHRRVIDKMISSKKGSVRLATLFLLFYWSLVPEWNKKDIPVGIRGKYGDKRLAEELKKRNITLHDNITAFGENLGWKGNVREFDLSSDQRFSAIAELGVLSTQEVETVALYLAKRFAESQVIINPLPDVGDDILTFARARTLLSQLVALRSEGHIQQFLVAAMLEVHREPHGYEVRTHHPHASDKYDATAGDIEEFYEGHLRRAYEVTVRPDWKNRISNFKNKMDEFGLSKYVIIASDISNDPEWGEPAEMLTKLEHYGRDIAVVDINEFMNVFAAELSAKELRNAINRTHEFLMNDRLCGRPEIIEKYAEAVSHWLDSCS
ncbi:hypothetical protein J3362_19360 [Marinobacter sp. NFXS11]|uniref:hypothetical protein n=1 Tax=Marinobacter sp. NFXS11 TaxID=2818432 RepID=UPI0032DFA9AE